MLLKSNMRVLCSLAFLFIVGIAAGQEYQLSFDWKMNKLSTDVDVCTVTWNDATLITLKEKEKSNKIHHETIALDFKEGVNQISFFFIGSKGQITIDNVMLIKPPKTINLIVNGDFQMSRLHQKESMVFNDRIPGWNAPKIHILKQNKMNRNDKQDNQALVLNSRHYDINQKISFGKVRKYSFMSTFSEDIKKKANDIIAQKLGQYSSFIDKNHQTGTFDKDPSQDLGQSHDDAQYFKNMANSQSFNSGSLKTQVLDTLNSLKDPSFLTSQHTSGILSSATFGNIDFSKIVKPS